MVRLRHCPDRGVRGPAATAGRAILVAGATLAALAAALGGCGASTTVTSSTPALYINELMAQNDTSIADTDGNGGYPDWIEIYNAEATSVDLGGMYLTDNLKNPTKWRIPDGVVIPAGGHLLFWADNDPEQGSTHMTFKLDTAGEEIGLFNTAANGYAAIDAVTFGQQVPDVSYGRSPDGSNTWTTFSAPTPGRANP
jgi:hypothetical protein